MSDAEISQELADQLMAMPKASATDDEFPYPGAGGAIAIPLRSLDRREEFVLDISRGRIKLAKSTYQHRARQVVVLARL